MNAFEKNTIAASNVFVLYLPTYTCDVCIIYILYTIESTYVKMVQF